MKRRVLEVVRRTITRHGMLRSTDSVLVAVSGGADSVALAVALRELDRGGWRLAIGHVDHGLRGEESSADRRFVERLGRSLGIAVHVADGSLPIGANLEERAREVRYRRLHEIAAREGCRVVATAHTRDDQAETFLLRLLRGSGAAGLTAIHAVRADGVVRPLLDCSRREVTAFLRHRRVAHRTDRTNRDPRFTRNRLRSELLPLLERRFNPSVGAVLARTAELLADDDAVLEAAARRAMRRSSAGEELEVASLRRLSPAIGRRVLRLWLADRRGGLRRIAAVHVDRLLALALDGGEGAELSLPGGRIVRSAGAVGWRGEERAVARGFDRPLVVGSTLELAGWRLRSRVAARNRAGRPTEWCGRFDLGTLDGSPLRVRSALRGDRLRPLGLRGSKKLQDVFVDAKVTRDERRSWPVVTNGDRILWLPGLVRSEHALISSRSRRVLIVEAERV